MTDVAFEYDGFVYVRPVSRGVVMLETPGGTYVEDAVRDGYYRMSVRFERLSEIEEKRARKAHQ